MLQIGSSREENLVESMTRHMAAVIKVNYGKMPIIQFLDARYLFRLRRYASRLSTLNITHQIVIRTVGETPRLARKSLCKSINTLIS